MASRSRGRQFAVQLLYQKIFSGYELNRVCELFWRNVKVQKTTREFSEQLVAGVLEQQAQLDMEITGYLVNWTLDRIVPIDRIILQIAYYELLFSRDVPWKVVVDEAILLARLFSSEKSVTFINGVLHAWVTRNLDVDVPPKADP